LANRSLLVNQRLIASVVLGLGVAWLADERAYGQRYTGARVSRPSKAGASVQLGRVGGLNTGRYGDPMQLTNVAPDALGFTDRGLSQPNFYGGGWRMARLPAPPLPQAFLTGNLGVNAPMAPSPWARVLRGVGTPQLAAASRLDVTFGLSVPLGGIGPTGVRLPNSPFFAPTRHESAFHAFYGIRPAEPKSLATPPIPASGWVGLLERANDESLVRRKTDAFEQFKAATSEGVELRFERLSEAQAALRLVRNLDRESYLPCVLLLHIALEKRQLVGAIDCLVDAVERHPGIFVERPDLAAYCGDPEFLTRTARAYLKIGESARTPEAYALQAYCAWILDDQARFKDAVAAITAGDLAVPRTDEIFVVRDALAAAAK
jgi:hypothetical protein